MGTDVRIIVPTAGTPFVAAPEGNKVAEPLTGGIALSGLTPFASAPTGIYSYTNINVDSLGYSNGTSWSADSVITNDFDQKTELTYAKGPTEISGVRAFSGSQSYKFRTFAGGSQAGCFRSMPSGVDFLDKTYFQYQYKTYFPSGFDFTANNDTSVKFHGFNTYPSGTERLWIKIRQADKRFALSDEGYTANNYNFGATNTVQFDVWQTWTLQINVSTTLGVNRFQMWGAGGTLGSGVLLTDSWVDQPNQATAGLTVVPGGPSSKSPTWRHFDNWNNNGTTIPPAQDWWVDDIYITDSDNPLSFTGGIPDII